MKSILLFVTVLLSAPGFAAQYKCATADKKITGDFGFVEGYPEAAELTYVGRRYVATPLNKTTHDAQVQDYSYKGADGFYVQMLIPRGVAVLFSVHSTDKTDNKLVGTADVFDPALPMQQNDVMCLYFK